ncbi:hypothetical protein SELMODRAFT_410926 [Selaginella moellendorffii]|uniref:Mon2/Sec7/BIG1-like HDS domain-containing protein n=1 Tax=Selaginella moellendorffii TaxID=88036 RepID=D8RGB2_SELML|nr:hypothetical protein SELMODRAFT_410926 [Selaginella moellendorffii]
MNIVIQKPKEEKLFRSSEDAICYMQDQLKEKLRNQNLHTMLRQTWKLLSQVSWGPMLAGPSVPQGLRRGCDFTAPGRVQACDTYHCSDVHANTAGCFCDFSCKVYIATFSCGCQAEKRECYQGTSIRLVWRRMWNTLSDYFVTVGCSSNFSVAMYTMDSLWQLADRDELANYNFQSQFMWPFVIIMQRSASVEIQEFIIRCVSQMVCNVRSGLKITFIVTKFSESRYCLIVAVTDRDSAIVHLVFETGEGCQRYFQHITETESTIFRAQYYICLLVNKFNDDISLNALTFLRFCALKLGEGELRSVWLVGQEVYEKSSLYLVTKDAFYTEIPKELPY